MHTKHYVSTQSFWMFVGGLVVGALLLMAAMIVQNAREDGSASLLRYTDTSTVDTRSGIDPGFMPRTTINTVDTVSGIDPGFMPTADTISGIDPGF